MKTEPTVFVFLKLLLYGFVCNTTKVRTNMLEHEKRVVDECTELEIKIDKLIEFMHGDTYPTLFAVDQGMLMVQLSHMKSYASVLRDRIERFDRNGKAL